MLAIGLMSGTSLDGVDACLVEIENDKFNLLKYSLHKYDDNLKARIFKNLNDETAKLSEISKLNFILGNEFVKAIDKLLNGTNYKYDDIFFVASHGQTIWHDPKNSEPSTFQIGEASVIRAKTGITVVSDFRVLDVSLGGEGAPLVPFSEYIIFNKTKKNIILQNIGGISNLTYINKNANKDDVKAFDCGVGNMMIDYFVQKYFGIPYDEDGKIAKSGKIINEILDCLKKDSFIYKNPPKSTGRERYTREYFEQKETELLFNKYDKKDIITTITEFTVFTIVYNYKTFIKDFDEVIVSGGGSHNKYIMERLQKELNKDVVSSFERGIDADAKEALCFCILGYETLCSRCSNLISVTGAREYASLGVITPGKRGIRCL